MKCSLCGKKIGFMETQSLFGTFTICAQCERMKEQLSEEPQTAQTAASYFTQCIDNRTAIPEVSKLLADALATYHKKFRLWQLEQDRFSQLIQNASILHVNEDEAELRSIRAKIYEQNQSAIEKSFLSTSCSTLDGYTIKSQCGIVCTSVVFAYSAKDAVDSSPEPRPVPKPVPINSFKEWLVFGDELWAEWRCRTALDGLIHKAFLLGCNALVGVRFNSVRLRSYVIGGVLLNSNVIELDAYGTAVVVEKSNSDC